MAKITVVDSLMGTGKSSWARQYINDNWHSKFVYITPLLSEVEKTITSCPVLQFFQPQIKGKTKAEDFNDLLMHGFNVASTHCTFSRSNEETYSYIRRGNYTLVLDEEIDVLCDFNDMVHDKDERMKPGDIKLMLDQKLIATDEKGRVSWIGNDYKDSHFDAIQEVSKNGNLYLINDSFLVWLFPTILFEAFDRVFILSYLFHGSMLEAFFQQNQIDYDMMSVGQCEDGTYKLIEYTDFRPQIAELKKLIHICDDKYINAHDNCSLSMSDYKRSSKADRKILQKQTYRFFHSIKKAKSCEILWTAPKKYHNDLKGKGYSKVRLITKEERDTLTKAELKQLEDSLNCFIACNAKGTNMYGDRSVLAYILNYFPNPYLLRFFEGTSIDEDRISLASLLQWIWRSRIRNQQEIWIWIPATRMRSLLIDWLDGKF